MVTCASGNSSFDGVGQQVAVEWRMSLQPILVLGGDDD